MELEPIKGLYLFGGGNHVIRLAEKARDLGLEVTIITSPRHAAASATHDQTFFSLMNQNGFPIYVLPSLKAGTPPLSEIPDNTLGISLGAAWIFNEPVIRLFNGRLVNSHGSQLPLDRGGAIMTWRILRGNVQGSCAIHLIAPGVDSGDIVCNSDFSFSNTCRIPKDYYDEQEDKDLHFLEDFLRKAHAGHSFNLTSQDEQTSTYWPRLESKLHGAIDWEYHVDDIEKFICAFDEPFPGAYTYLYGNQLILKDCIKYSSDGVFHPFQTGLIYRIYEGKSYIACRGGNILVKRLEHPDGSNATDNVSVGDRLWTPKTILEQARSTRVFYTPTVQRYKPSE